MSTARYVDELVMKADTADTVSKMSSMGGTFQQVAAGITAGAAAMSAAGFSAGAAWEDSRDKIIAASGATGDELKGLQADVRALAQGGWGLEESTTAIIEVNRHLGLTGDEAQGLGTALLQSGADAGKFGKAANQMGLDAEGAKKFLDQLTVASQRSGVSVDDMSDEIIDHAGDWDEGGASMEHLAASVVQASLEFGKGGLETSLGLLTENVTKGVIPSVQSLETSLGDTTGAVQTVYAESRTWRDALTETKDALIATVAPYGDMVGAMGSVTTAAFGFLTAFPGAAGLVSTAAHGMWVALTGPVGLVVGGIALLGTTLYNTSDTFRDFANNAWRKFLDAIKSGYNWIARFVPGLEEIADRAEFETAPALEHVATAEVEIVDEGRPIPSLMASIGAAGAQAAQEVKFEFDKLKGPGGISDTISGEAFRLASRFPNEMHRIGGMGAEAFDLSLMQGPGGIGTTMPLHMIRTIAATQGQAVPALAGMGSTGAGSIGFMGKFFGALTGDDDPEGGGFLGRMGSFMTIAKGGWESILKTGLSMVPVVGPLLANFSGAIMKGLKGVGKAITGWWKGLWNGLKSIAGSIWGGLKRAFGFGGGGSSAGTRGDEGGGTPTSTPGSERAFGGPMSAGRPYLVGEHGPELFVPRSAGNLSPNHALAAAGGIGGTIVIQNMLDGEVVSEQTIRLDQRMRDRIGIGEA